MLRWKRSVLVSFAREILSRRKNVIYILYREIAKKTSHVPRLHNFQRALSTTDGKTDVGARPAGSWNPIHVSRAWMDACWFAFLIVRISSRTCPPNVFSVYLRYLVHIINVCFEFESSTGEFVRTGIFREILHPFFFRKYASFMLEWHRFI